MKVFTFCLLFFLAGVSVYVFQNEDELAILDLWLEEVEGERALNWVRGENLRTTSDLEQNPLFNTLQDEADKILNSKDKLISARQFDGYAYNFWRDESHIKGIWRRQLWESYVQGDTDWETLISFDELAKNDQKSWVFQGANCLTGTTRCLLRLSDGGTDASYLKEFDLSTKEFVVDGFQAEASKSSYTWVNTDELLVASTFGENSVTDSGYPKKIHVWQRGKKITDGRVIFTGEQTDVSVRAVRLEDQGEVQYLITRSPTFFTTKNFIWTGKELIDLGLPDDIKLAELIQGQLVLELRSEHWGVPSGSLISMGLQDLLEGNKKPQEIFKPSQTQSVERVLATKDFVIVNYLEDVKGKVMQFKFDGTSWSGQAISLPDNGTISVFGSSEKSNEFLASYQDHITPPTLYNIDPATKTQVVVQSVPKAFNSDGLEVTQKFSTSKDGTKIPYFLIHRKGMVLDGRNPTILYGYGGFEISLKPYYMGAMGKLWLERGGVYVVANIRGGGEYGPEWHQAVLKEKRHLAYDDFISVAEELIASKVTSPNHLAIRGGSNGGLLVGAVATRRPDLFKGVLCLVPLLDMMRFHTLLAGASWMGEYGNPEDPEMGDYIRSYSPYHNVKSEVEYPEIFFITSTKDDRVHPAHARRMAFKMQALNKDFYYYENIEGGHSASANLKQRAYQYALELSYLIKKIGLPGRES